MNKTTSIVIVIIILLIVGGGAFYFGMNYGKSQSAALSTAARANFAGMRGSRTGGANASFISGSIIAKDNTSITLQLPSNAGSKIIFYSTATQISKMAAGTADDLAVGTSVSITGTTNSDGSITSQSIQIRPAKK